jgi:hypothetical protein
MLYKIPKFVNLMYTKKKNIRLGGLCGDSPNCLPS